MILGATNKPKLFVIDFENCSTESIILDKRCKKVNSIKVQNEWIISCFVHKTEVFINGKTNEIQIIVQFSIKIIITTTGCISTHRTTTGSNIITTLYNVSLKK